MSEKLLPNRGRALVKEEYFRDPSTICAIFIANHEL